MLLLDLALLRPDGPAAAALGLAPADLLSQVGRGIVAVRKTRGQTKGLRWSLSGTGRAVQWVGSKRHTLSFSLRPDGADGTGELAAGSAHRTVSSSMHAALRGAPERGRTPLRQEA